MSQENWCTPDVLQRIDVAAKIGLGLLALRIAMRQANVAADKLRFDLFERREEMFNLAVKFIDEINARSAPNWDLINTFQRERQPAQWLFDDSIVSYLTELEDHAMRMIFLEAELAEPRPNPLHTPHEGLGKTPANNFHVERVWFIGQRIEIGLVFAPFLVLQRSMLFGRMHSRRLALVRKTNEELIQQARKWGHSNPPVGLLARTAKSVRQKLTAWFQR